MSTLTNHSLTHFALRRASLLDGACVVATVVIGGDEMGIDVGSSRPTNLNPWNLDIRGSEGGGRGGGCGPTTANSRLPFTENARERLCWRRLAGFTHTPNCWPVAVSGTGILPRSPGCRHRSWREPHCQANLAFGEGAKPSQRPLFTQCSCTPLIWSQANLRPSCNTSHFITGDPLSHRDPASVYYSLTGPTTTTVPLLHYANEVDCQHPTGRHIGRQAGMWGVGEATRHPHSLKRPKKLNYFRHSGSRPAAVRFEPALGLVWHQCGKHLRSLTSLQNNVKTSSAP